MWKQATAVAFEGPIVQPGDFKAKLFDVQILNRRAFVLWEEVLKKPHFWKQLETGYEPVE